MDEIARQATWVIESDNDEQGTAFFLQGRGLVTCSHCLGTNPYVWHPDYPSKKYKVTVIAEDKHRDLAILRAPSDLVAQPLPLYTGPKLKTGTPVILFGYPNHGPGRNIRVESGTLLRTFPRSGISYHEITPKIIGGNSGGPVVTSSYHVAGIAVRGVSGSTTLSTAEFFAIDAEELRLWPPSGPTGAPKIP